MSVWAIRSMDKDRLGIYCANSSVPIGMIMSKHNISTIYISHEVKYTVSTNHACIANSHDYSTKG